MAGCPLDVVTVDLSQQVELIFVVASALVLVGYHRWLAWKVEKNPTETVRGSNALLRAAWVEDIMSRREPILGVQTLRNSTMAASFMASTSVVLMFGTLNLIVNVEKLAGFFKLNVMSQSAELLTLKLLLLIIDLFVAFFSFALAVRGYNQVGYLLNTPRDRPELGVTPEVVTQRLGQAHDFNSMGLRAYFIVVPLVVGLFGSLWMLMASLFLVFFLSRLDRLHGGMQG